MTHGPIFVFGSLYGAFNFWEMFIFPNSDESNGVKGIAAGLKFKIRMNLNNLKSTVLVKLKDYAIKLLTPSMIIFLTT